MRAVQIVDLTGPSSALAEVDLPEPEPSHMLTPGSGVMYRRLQRRRAAECDQDERRERYPFVMT